LLTPNLRAPSQLWDPETAANFAEGVAGGVAGAAFGSSITKRVNFATRAQSFYLSQDLLQEPNY
jgi:hypothetical protein